MHSFTAGFSSWVTTLGLMSSATSLLASHYGLNDLALNGPILDLVWLIRSFFHPLLERIADIISISLSEWQKDLLAVYFIFGLTITRLVLRDSQSLQAHPQAGLALADRSFFWYAHSYASGNRELNIPRLYVHFSYPYFLSAIWERLQLLINMMLRLVFCLSLWPCVLIPLWRKPLVYSFSDGSIFLDDKKKEDGEFFKFNFRVVFLTHLAAILTAAYSLSLLNMLFS